MSKKDRLKNSIKKIRNSKGFTLIELIVVIAILGILVLLAAPKFLGYTSDAKLAAVKADVKSYEALITAKLTKDPESTKNWNVISNEDMEQYKNEDSLFYVKGEVPDTYELNKEYLDIPEDEFKSEIKTNLPGNFIWGSDGKVYYQDSNIKDLEDNSDGDDSGENEGNQSPEVQEIDTDGDGVFDNQDADPNDPNKTGKDTDNDTLDDAYETNVSKTDPNNKDTDGDGKTDGDEIKDNQDPLVANDYSAPNILFKGLSYVNGSNGITGAFLNAELSDPSGISKVNFNYESGYYGYDTPYSDVIYSGQASFMQVAGSGETAVNTAIKNLAGKEFTLGAEDALGNNVEYKIFLDSNWVYAEDKATGKTYIVTPSTVSGAKDSSGSFIDPYASTTYTLPSSVNGKTIYGMIGTGPYTTNVENIIIPDSYEVISALFSSNSKLKTVTYNGNNELKTVGNKGSMTVYFDVTVQGTNADSVKSLAEGLNTLSNSNRFK